MLPAKKADICSRFFHTEPLVRSFNAYDLPDIRVSPSGIQHDVALDLGGEFDFSFARSSVHRATGSICSTQSHSNLPWAVRPAISREPGNRRRTEALGSAGCVRGGGHHLPHCG